MASDTVFKYRTWNNEFHRSALISNELYFSPPDQLNDPFDFKIRPDFSMLDDIEKVTQFANNAVDVFKDEFDKEKIDEARSSIIKNLSENPLHYQEKYISDTSKHENENYGVLCFSQVWDNVLMWTHYAENHQGFCLGFHKKEIPGEYFGASIHVNYQHEYPKINPLDPALKRIILHFGTKSKVWEYEKEFRLVRLIKQNDRIYTYSHDQLKEVILGLRMSESNQTEILSIAQKADIPVFKMIAKEKTFGLDKVQISGPE